MSEEIRIKVIDALKNGKISQRMIQDVTVDGKDLVVAWKSVSVGPVVPKPEDLRVSFDDHASAVSAAVEARHIKDFGFPIVSPRTYAESAPSTGGINPSRAWT